MASPNMNLTIPSVGITIGPDYANEINADLSLLDQHDHTPGNGVAITPAGMSITSDLSFQSNNATVVRSTRFTTNASPLALSTDLGCIYRSGVDLYYNDGNGVQIRLTQSGAISGTSGNITNLVSPASVTYVSGTPAYVFQSAALTSANLDGGSLTLRQNIASANGVTLHSPTSLAANYSVTFPAALPGGTKIMSIDSSGNIGVTYDVDNSTLQIASSVIRVKDAGITLAKMAANSVGTSQLVDASVTKAKLVASDYQQSSSCDTYVVGTSVADVTNLSLSVTTGGRPVFIGLIPDGAADSRIAVASTGDNEVSVVITLVRDSTTIASNSLYSKVDFTATFNSLTQHWAVSSIGMIDVPSSGTYTYKVQAVRSNGSGNSALIVRARLIAYTL